MTTANLPLRARQAAVFIDHWRWLILLLAAPAFLFPSPARAPLLLVLPGLWLAAGLAGRGPLPRTPLNGALLLFSIMLLVSLWTTFDLAYSLSKVTGLLLGLGAFFAIARQVRGPSALWRAVALFILAGGGLALLGLVGIDWLNKLPLLAAVSQRLPAIIRGLPGAEEGLSANSVAGALIFFLPLQVVMLTRTWRVPPRDWPRCWPWQTFADPLTGGPRLWLSIQLILLLLVGGLLVLTQSRGAWLGFAAALALLLAASGRRVRWLLLAGAAAGGLGLVVLGGPSAALSLAARVIGADVGAKVIQRQTLWYYGLLAIRAFPFTGMGLNMFRLALPVLYPTVPLPAGYDITHAHNHLLQAAINFGLPGLVAYLALWLGAAYALLSAYRASADPWLRALAVGLAAGLTAEFVFGATDAIDFGSRLGLFFWLTLALTIGLYQVVRAPEPSD